MLVSAPQQLESAVNIYVSPHSWACLPPQSPPTTLSDIPFGEPLFNPAHAQLLQSCSTLCDAMEWTPPGSSIHGILQARILEWVTVLSSRGSFNPGIKPTSPVSLYCRQILSLVSHMGSLAVPTTPIFNTYESLFYIVHTIMDHQSYMFPYIMEAIK